MRKIVYCFRRRAFAYLPACMPAWLLAACPRIHSWAMWTCARLPPASTSSLPTHCNWPLLSVAPSSPPRRRPTLCLRLYGHVILFFSSVRGPCPLAAASIATRLYDTYVMCVQTTHVSCCLLRMLLLLLRMM